MSVGFYNVFNFKQAILQEMEFQGWNLYDPSAPKPPVTDYDSWSYYYRYRYYKDFQQYCVQLKPVLVPYNSIINAWKKQRCLVTGENYDDLPENWLTETPWKWNYELFSDINYLPGEIEDSCVVDLGNCLSHVLTDAYDVAQNYGENTYSAQFYDKAISNYATGVNKIEYFNKIFDSDLSYTGTGVAKGKLEDSFEVFMKYTNNDGSIASTNPIVYDTTTRGSYPEFTTNRRLLRGKTTPRVVVENNEYVLYMKYEQNLPGQSLPTFRYIPIYNPYIGLTTVTNVTIRDSAFGFIPFNQYQVFDSTDVIVHAYSLPPITFSTNNQIPTINLHAPHEYWNNPCIVPELSIKQYFYLAGVPIVSSETTDGILTPWNELEKGEKPINTGGGSGDPSIPDNPESGTTSNPGGTVSGGEKVEGEYTTPTTGEGYPVQTYLLPPGIYGGLYIPTYRYVRSVSKDISSLPSAIDEFNKIIRGFETQGKGAAIVEAFFHYSKFINRDNLQLPFISLFIERPTYLCGFDKASKDAYTPINNKLFIYPYCSMELNGYGQINELRFENFSSTKPELRIVSKFQPGSTIFVYPANYGGVKNNYDGGVAGQPLAILPYTKNDFLNEYNASQNSRSQAIQNINDVHAVTQTQTLISGITQALGGVGGSMQIAGATPNLGKTSGIGMGLSAGASLGGGLAMTGYQYYANTVQRNAQLATYEAQLKDIENRPLAVANQNAAPSLPELITNSPAPFVVWKSIRKEFAEKIDIYFSKFGYKVSKFKEINIKTRPRYNFIKCADCHVHGSIPQDDLMTIKSIMESGITFWHDTRVGDYGDYKDNLAPTRDNPKYLKPSYMEV